MSKAHEEHNEEKHESTAEPHEGHGKKVSPGIAIFIVALIIIAVFLILSGKLKF